MSLGDRVEAMLQRTADASAFLDADDRDRLARALRAALTHRREILPQEDPRILHPARTVLILTDDMKLVDADALIAGALAESQAPVLRVDEAAIPDVAAVAVLELQRDSPDANGEASLEILLTADPVATDIALAERLDYLRHLHLRPALEWSASFDTARDAYLPVAQRRGGIIARRYEWWCSMFERKYVTGDEAP